MKRMVGMLLVLVLGCGSQESAVATLEELGAIVEHDENGIVALVQLSFSEITDTGLEHFKELTNLEYLDLSGCEKITDAGLVHLKRLP